MVVPLIKKTQILMIDAQHLELSLEENWIHTTKRLLVFLCQEQSHLPFVFVGLDSLVSVLLRNLTNIIKLGIIVYFS